MELGNENVDAVTTPDASLGQDNSPVQEPASDVDNSSPDNAAAQPAHNWQEDKRYSTYWKEDPNEMYGSYKSLEQKLQDNGSKIKEYEGQIDNLTKSSNEANDLRSYIESMQNHPEYSGKLTELVDGFNKAARREAYGADLPDHVVERLGEIDNIKAELAERKEQEAVAEQEKIVSSQLKEIEDVAKKYNIAYDDKVKDEFVKWCLEKNISPSNLRSKFLEKALDEGNIAASVANKTQEKVIKNITKNKAGSLPSGSNNNKPLDNDNLSMADRMLQAIRKSK